MADGHGAAGLTTDTRPCTYVTRPLSVPRYSQPVTKDGLEAQVSNPEAPVDPLYVDSDINEAIVELKRATVRLRDAYNGQTVTWEQPGEWAARHSLTAPAIGYRCLKGTSPLNSGPKKPIHLCIEIGYMSNQPSPLTLPS